MACPRAWGRGYSIAPVLLSGGASAVAERAYYGDGGVALERRWGCDCSGCEGEEESL